MELGELVYFVKPLKSDYGIEIIPWVNGDANYKWEACGLYMGQALSSFVLIDRSQARFIYILSGNFLVTKRPFVRLYLNFDNCFKCKWLVCSGPSVRLVFFF